MHLTLAMQGVTTGVIRALTQSMDSLLQVSSTVRLSRALTRAFLIRTIRRTTRTCRSCAASTDRTKCRRMWMPPSRPQPWWNGQTQRQRFITWHQARARDRDLRLRAVTQVCRKGVISWNSILVAVSCLSSRRLLCAHPVCARFRTFLHFTRALYFIYTPMILPCGKSLTLRIFDRLWAPTQFQEAHRRFCASSQ